MAQLVERLLLTPEFRGLNLDIGKLLYGTFFTVNCIKKTKIKKKRPGMAHFCLKMSFIRSAAEAQKLLCLNTFNLSSLSFQSAS